ncbi:hypothetical protein CYMTET_50689 [Cymbomonas tetramitiformis]|uniref:Uncharacterized protein n=1 Tax=Cymbomonas tetramitiformis TaxID=36881 RepID=A0AAE0BMI4_9CHLO|nr:hypothetical protein CYMTET_50689 [Cymbomonas tetramitiformis]
MKRARAISGPQRRGRSKLSKANTGPLPGVTRHQQNFKIGSRPSTYIIDTPGVMVPRIEDMQTGLKLAITGSVKDRVVGEEELARFLLAQLVMHPKGLEEAAAKGPRDPASLLRSVLVQHPEALSQDYTEQVYQEMLDGLAHITGAPRKDEQQLIQARTQTSKKLLAWYRQGALGRFTLDTI